MARSKFFNRITHVVESGHGKLQSDFDMNADIRDYSVCPYTVGQYMYSTTGEPLGEIVDIVDKGGEDDPFRWEIYIMDNGFPKLYYPDIITSRPIGKNID